MALHSGDQLGPYEVIDLLGSGGMGEVYRCRDPRLKREVAVKVLPAEMAVDADRMRRFEQEARATAALNHPNILAIYDVGTFSGSPFLVSEVLKGETLEKRLGAGALPARKATTYGLQIAHGLAAAHAEGITHRDLKPGNIFLTRDGQVKILDFGLAKLAPSQAESEPASAPTVAASEAPGTVVGMILGSVGYMSPEQVRGQPADARSDIFSFGAILYEMLSGKKAFSGATSADVLSAILKDEPPELLESSRNIPPALERIVKHCLEKAPGERFQSIRDLAFDLESLNTQSGTPAGFPGEAAAAQGKAKKYLPAILLGIVVGLLLANVLLIKKVHEAAGAGKMSEVHALTFRRGTVSWARFANDGQTVVYSAAWEGHPEELFSTRAGSPESSPLGLGNAELLALSSSGEIALKLHPRRTGPFTTMGTLARAALSGGAPREVVENVMYADWAPDGNLAIIRQLPGVVRLEYPLGNVLYESKDWLGDLRISPDGKRIAFVDHPFGGDEGAVGIVDLPQQGRQGSGKDDTDKNGKAKILSSGWLSLQGLAWSQDGSEIWFTGTKVGTNRALYAVSPAGKERAITRIPASLSIFDVSRDGRVLLKTSKVQDTIQASIAGDNAERNLSWFDSSIPIDLSADGKTLIFIEAGEGAGEKYGIYLRRTDGAPPARLGDGWAWRLSPDRKWVLATLDNLKAPRQLSLLSVGAGQTHQLTHDALDHSAGAWLPDNKRIIFLAREDDKGSRFYVQDINGGNAAPITPEVIFNEIFGVVISPDGKLLIAKNLQNQFMLYPINGGTPVVIKGMEEGDDAVGWTNDSRNIFVFQRGDAPARVYKLDPVTGSRMLWKELAPFDPAGLKGVFGVVMTAGAKSYAYGYRRETSDLYLIEGLR